MGLKILHSADWHLDSPFASLPEPIRRMAREHQRQLPGKIADLCRQEQCDLMLLAGDLFDTIPHRETVENLKRALGRCGVPVFISPGNHDFCGPGSPWLEESWPENVHIFRGELAYFDLPELNCRVYGAGYRSMDCPGLLAGFQASGSARYCVGVLHGDPVSLNSPCCPVTAAQVRESGLDYLALGHIHKAGSFRAGDTLCAWPGCPMGRGWDETGEKGLSIVTLGSGAELRWVPLGLPQFHDLKVTVRSNPEAALEAVLPPAASEDLFRVTLEGTGDPNLGALKRRFSHLAYLEFRDETAQEIDPWAWSQDDSLRGLYFNLLQEQLDSATPENAEIIRLAADISWKLMEGREVTLP